jgi:hypothetical protein
MVESWQGTRFRRLATLLMTPEKIDLIARQLDDRCRDVVD